MKLGPLEPFDSNNPKHIDSSEYVIEYETTGRKPSMVSFDADLSSDLSRRDITINAMAIDRDGNIIDYFDGLRDVKNKMIRTAGNPLDRFMEDHLRLLRVNRFASKLGFEIHPETKKMAKELAHHVTKLSVERIKEEIFKAAKQQGERFAQYLVYLDEVGLLDLILPEVSRLKGLEQDPQYHPEGSVWQHTLEALRTSKVIDPLVNLAILLHDVGKAMTRGEKSTGQPSYYGHEDESTKVVNQIADRLKMSNEERETLLFAVGNHMRFHKIKEMKPSKIAKLVTHKDWDVLAAVGRADWASRGGRYNPKDYEDIVQKAMEVKYKWGSQKVGEIVKIVSGEDVMSLTGLKPGSKVGTIIKKVTEYALDHGITDKDTINKLIIKISKEV
jgi:tRNA nucleotidyltransferase/poly(A) polymerase